jgi:hypothetical protein
MTIMDARAAYFHSRSPRIRTPAASLAYVHGLSVRQDGAPE